MKRRLRKKLCLREFREFVFRVSFQLTIPNTDEENDAFADKLFSVLDAHGLLIGGTVSDFYVQTRFRQSVTDADRKLMRSWLVQQPEVHEVYIGPLIDAWYGEGKQLGRPGAEMSNTLAAHMLTQAGISF